MKTKATIELADLFNGHKMLFFVEPIAVDGNVVKLQCAEPGKEHLIAWKYKDDLDSAPYEHPSMG